MAKKAGIKKEEPKIVDEVKEEELTLDKFNPTVVELHRMVEVSKSITATDLKDKEQLAIVKENRITLMRARTSIQKAGKALRENAIDFQRKVLEKEKELIAIIEPEEDRLAAIEEEAKLNAIREERLEKLPQRKERLAQVLADLPSDEYLLTLDAEAFESYLNDCRAARLEEERVELDQQKRAEQEKMDEERKKLEDDRLQLELEKREEQQKKEVREAEERGRIEAATRAKQEQEQKEKDRIAEEKREEIAKKEKAHLLAKRADYVKFLSDNGYTAKNKGDFKVEETPTAYVLFKKVGEFKK